MTQTILDELARLKEMEYRRLRKERDRLRKLCYVLLGEAFSAGNAELINRISKALYSTEDYVTNESGTD